MLLCTKSLALLQQASEQSVHSSEHTSQMAPCTIDMCMYKQRHHGARLHPINPETTLINAELLSCTPL